MASQMQRKLQEISNTAKSVEINLKDSGQNRSQNRTASDQQTFSGATLATDPAKQIQWRAVGLEGGSQVDLKRFPGKQSL